MIRRTHKLLSGVLVLSLFLSLCVPFLCVGAFAAAPVPALSVNVCLGEKFSLNASVDIPLGVSAIEAGIYVDGVKMSGIPMDGYYLVEGFFKTAAKETGKTVIVQAYYVADGKEVRGEEKETSIASMLRGYLDGTQAETAALAAATLNYAAATQLYFGYDIEHLVNAGLPATLPQNTYTDNFTVVSGMTDATVAPREMALLLNDTVDLHVSIASCNGAAVDFSTLRLAISESADMSGAASLAFDDRGIAVVRGISPAHWNDTYYFRIENSKGEAVSATFSYGISTYYARMLKNENEYLVELVKTMMVLYEALGAYVSSGAGVPTTPLSVAPTKPYALVGEEIVLRAAGTEGKRVSFAAPDGSVSSPATVGVTFTATAAKAGTHTFTVTDGARSASCTVTVFDTDEKAYAATDPLVRILGRTEQNADGAILLNNTAAGFEITFYGKSLSVDLANAAGAPDTTMIAVFVDGRGDAEVNKLDLRTAGVASGSTRRVTLASFDTAGLHTVRVQKVTEESLSSAIFSAVYVEGGLVPTVADEALRLMVFGDSITCGYGNIRPSSMADGNNSQIENGLLTYAMRAATMLNADAHIFSRSGLGLYTNPYGSTSWLKDIYGKVSPASNTDWDMTSWVPDAIVIGIGTNDIWAPNGSEGNVPYTKAGYVEAYMNFISELADIWGDDKPFFLCSSMMVPGLSDAVREVAACLTEQGLRVYFVDLPAQSNPTGHPDNASHLAAAKVLCQAIADVTEISPVEENEIPRDDISDIF